MMKQSKLRTVAKKAIAVWLILTLSIGLVPVCADAEQRKTGSNDTVFSDIDGHWAQADIAWCSENNLVNGITAGQYAPGVAVSRAMFVTVLFRIAHRLSYNLNGYTVCSAFPDTIDGGAWYAEAVAWAASSGIVNGCGDGRFQPDTVITREQIAVMLQRFLHLWIEYPLLGQTGGPSEFSDAGQISAWASASVANVAALGLMQGNADAFMPKAETDRAQMAAILSRLCKLCDEEGAIPLTSYMKKGVNYYENNATWFNPEAADTIYERGFDHVRICSKIGSHLNASYDNTSGTWQVTLPQDELTALRNMLSTCAQRGLTVILDLHGVRMPMASGTGFTTEPSDNLELFGAIWGTLAKDLRELPETVFFELINERRLDTPSAEAAIAAIRATGANNAERILVAYSYYWELEDEILSFGAYDSDPNIMWDIHNYEPSYLTNYNPSVIQPDGSQVFTYAWNRSNRRVEQIMKPEMEQRFITGEALQAKTGRKVWIGEWGINGYINGTADDFITDFMRAAVAHSITSTCCWVVDGSHLDRQNMQIGNMISGEWDEFRVRSIFGSR